MVSIFEFICREMPIFSKFTEAHVILEAEQGHENFQLIISEVPTILTWQLANLLLAKFINSKITLLFFFLFILETTVKSHSI